MLFVCRTWGQSEIGQTGTGSREGSLAGVAGHWYEHIPGATGIAEKLQKFQKR
jgi:hypothetical protein